MTTPMPWVDPEDFFVAHVAAQSRAFWLDGSGARPWSGRLSVIGWLDEDELSITEHADTRRVTAHRSGGVEVVGGDVFAALRRFGGTRAAPRDPHRWVGFLGYAARTDLPAITDADPDAVDSCLLRVRRFVTFDHARHRIRVVAPAAELAAWRAEIAALLARTPVAPPPVAPPAPRVVSSWDVEQYGRAFDLVQRHLRLGNSYETNLTFRTAVESDADPLSTQAALTVGIAVGLAESDAEPELDPVHPVRARVTAVAATTEASRARRARAIGTGSILPHATLMGAARRADAAGRCHEPA